MDKPYDILLDEDFDMQAKDGDFIVGDATLQHQQLLLLSQKGEFKQSPYVGVGISNFLLDDANVHELHQEIQNQFEIDGMKIIEITGKTWEETEITASYE